MPAASVQSPIEGGASGEAGLTDRSAAGRRGHHGRYGLRTRRLHVCLSGFLSGRGMPHGLDQVRHERGPSPAGPPEPPRGPPAHALGSPAARRPGHQQHRRACDHHQRELRSRTGGHRDAAGRRYLEAHGQGHVLRVPSTFRLTLACGITMTCAQAVPPAHRRAPLGDPLRRGRVQGAALVCVGAAGHRLAAASPANPPPPGQWRAGLPLLLRRPRPAREHGPADPRRRAPLAGRRRFRIQQGTASAPANRKSGSTGRSPATPCWSWPH